MPIFLAACAALLILAVILGQRLRAAERRDTLGLRAARADVLWRTYDAVFEAAEAQAARDVVYLRVPRSFRGGRERLDDFHREDR